MIASEDFLELRAAVRTSVVGAAASRFMAAVTVAWSEAVVTQWARRGLTVFSELPSEVVIRSLGSVVAIAALAAWAMSLAIPTYLSTSIPAWAFIFCGFAAAVAAAWPEAFAHQWSRSLARRVSFVFRRR